MSEMHDRSAEFAVKLVRLRSLLASLGAGAAVMRSRRNFAWLTAGGDSHVVRASDMGVATILVTARDVIVLTAVNEQARIQEEELAGLPIEVVAGPWEAPDALSDEIRRRVSGVVLDDDALEPHLWTTRATLLDSEIERLTLLGSRTAAAVTRTLLATRSGDLEAVVGERLVARWISLPTASMRRLC